MLFRSAAGRWSIQSWAAVAAICVAPPLACVVLWRDWKSVAAGAAVWALSVTVKYAIAIFLGGVDEFAIEDRLGIPRRNQA